MQRFMEHRLLSRTRITHHSCVRVLRFCQLWCRPSCLTSETRYPPEVIANGQRKAASDSNDLPAPPLSISGLCRRGAIDTSAECELREPRRRRCVSGSACKKRARAGCKGGRRRKKRPTKNSLIKPAIGTPTAPPAGRRRGSARSSSTAGTRAARLQPRGTSVSSLGDWPTRAWPAGSGCAPSSQPILSSTSATTYREARALAQDCDLLSP